MTDTPAFRAPANDIANGRDTDVLLFNGPTERETEHILRDLFKAKRRRKNLLIILVTEGGDAGAAFRIARRLQRLYERLEVFISGYCKSAGTLLALGANGMVFSDDGELGPLDVQLSKKDEIFETQSGLTATSALTTLHTQAFLAFEHFLLQTKLKGRPSITARMATDIAVRLTTGLFAPIYQQIDPMHVGEAGRAMQIAQKYGELLQERSGNFSAQILVYLVAGYPSHDFTIDREEAGGLFRDVRAPDGNEVRLHGALGDLSLIPRGTVEDSRIEFLSSEVSGTVSNGGTPHGEETQILQPQPTATGAGGEPAQVGRVDGTGRSGSAPPTSPGE